MKSASIEFDSEGARVRGRFFQAVTTVPAPTILFVPGWPGNPDDVLGLGELLVEHGINMCMFNPRGLYQSEGVASAANTLNDIGGALQWLQRADVQRRFTVDTTRIALGGHSYGGGMALAYAARDPSVRRVISIAGTDHAEFVREIQRNAVFAEDIRRELQSTCVPEGPANFDVEAGLQEFADYPDVYGLRENAAKLADRSILLIGGWEDENVTVDQYILPFYRALKKADAAQVAFLVYHTDHGFSNVRERLASDIADWLLCVRT